VVEWFFLDWVYVDGARVTVDQRIESPAVVFSHATVAALAIGNHALVWAEVATDVIVVMGGVAIKDGQCFFRCAVTGGAI